MKRQPTQGISGQFKTAMELGAAHPSERVRCEDCRYFELTHIGIQAGTCHALPQGVRVVSTYWCGMGKKA